MFPGERTDAGGHLVRTLRDHTRSRPASLLVGQRHRVVRRVRQHHRRLRNRLHHLLSRALATDRTEPRFDMRIAVVLLVLVPKVLLAHSETPLQAVARPHHVKTGDHQLDDEKCRRRVKDHRGGQRDRGRERSGRRRRERRQRALHHPKEHDPEAAELRNRLQGLDRARRIDQSTKPPHRIDPVERGNERGRPEQKAGLQQRRPDRTERAGEEDRPGKDQRATEHRDHHGGEVVRCEVFPAGKRKNSPQRLGEASSARGDRTHSRDAPGGHRDEHHRLARHRDLTLFPRLLQPPGGRGLATVGRLASLSHGSPPRTGPRTSPGSCRASRRALSSRGSPAAERHQAAGRARSRIPARGSARNA